MRGGGAYTTCAFIMSITTLVVLFTLAYTLGSSTEVKRREITLQLSATRLATLDKRLDDCVSQLNALARALRSPLALVPSESPEMTKGGESAHSAATTHPAATTISDEELIASLQRQKENIEADVANLERSVKNEATTYMECKQESDGDREAHLGAAVKNITEYLIQLDAEQKVLREHIHTMSGVRARKEGDMRALIRAYELEIASLLSLPGGTAPSVKREKRLAAEESSHNNSDTIRPLSQEEKSRRAQTMRDAYLSGTKLPAKYRSYMNAVFGGAKADPPYA